MAVNIANRLQRDGWPDFTCFRPYPPAATLRRWLDAAYARTRSLFAVLDGARIRVPRLPIVNPPVWELGHVAWFHEFWICRRGSFEAPALLKGADALYDSSRVPHDSRWHLELPDLEATWRYAERVREAAAAAIASDAARSDELAYFAALGVFHHDMHNEAFHYMWQTLGYPAPAPAPQPAGAAADPRPEPEEGDVELPAAVFPLGAAPGSGFVFDNEKWAHPVQVPGFAIARRAVSNAQFLAFVEEGGYRRAEFWSPEGAQMLARESLVAPRYWRREGGAWLARRFDRLIPLDPYEPVMHVSLHEAQAWCRWAGRRLPTEAEWERAAATAPNDDAKRRYPWGDDERRGAAGLDVPGAAPGTPAAEGDGPGGVSGWGVEQMLGSVWEWTASRFLPYPGFAADPYREYSAPWFVEHHQVLRGGSFATPRRLTRNTWRNFYRPERADVFCGFRTCALDR